jgi:cold shock CspA family protein
MQEKIKWFNDKRGYGYLEYKENGEVVVHFYNKDNSASFEVVLNLKEKTV